MADKATRFAPKNIRQIGVTLPTDKIYIEDYVMTYIKQLSDVLNEERRVLALIGWIKEEDGIKYSCVSGVVELIKDEGLCDYKDLLIGSNLKKLNKVKEDFYGELDFVGLCVISRNEWIRCDDGLYPFFSEGMMGDLLLVRDGVNEEQFFRYSNTNFKKQRGYFIYYDRNESMQNYMLCMKDGKSIEYGYSPSEIIDRKVDDKIRSFSIPKNAVYSTKGVSYKHIKDISKNVWNTRVRYAAASVATIALLVVGVMKVDEFEEVLKQKAIKLSKQTAKSMDNDSKKLEVETVAGELTIQDDLEQYVDGEADINNSGDKVEGKIDASNSSESQEGSKEANNSGGLVEENVDDSNSGELVEDNANASGESQLSNASVNSTQVKEVSGKGSSDNGVSGKNSEVSGEVTYDNEDVETVSNGIKKIRNIKYYIVRKGDALVDISRKVYGTHKKVVDIKRVNGLEDEDKIYIGQRLIMP